MSAPEFIDMNDPEFKATLATTRHGRSAPTFTQAFVYAGRWTIDCAYPDCANAELVKPGQSRVYCQECHYIAEVVWPALAEEIHSILARRPVPSTRNWAPAGHRQAIACGFPEGQTVDDLRAENREHL